MRFLLLTCLVLVGCQLPGEVAAPEPIVKVVSEKLAAVEQQLDFDPFDKQGLRNRATSVYYLIADDGSRVIVTLKEYSHAKVGDEFSSTQWKE